MSNMADRQYRPKSYGVYAAVFLHKAQGAGAIASSAERGEVNTVVLRFISSMEEASLPLAGSHLGTRYCRMLKTLWVQCPERVAPGGGAEEKDQSAQLLTPPARVQQPDSPEDPFQPRAAGSLAPMNAYALPAPSADGGGDNRDMNSFYDPWRGNTLFMDLPDGDASDFTTGAGDGSAFADIESYMFGSFLPGITEMY